MKIKSNSREETKKAGRNLAKDLIAGDVVALFGDLGSGKTTFVQGIAKGLGIKNKVVSPTYVFMRSYPFKSKNAAGTFYHIDLYRGETATDFRSLGLSEIFDKESVVVLEWADRIKNSLPKKRYEVHFKTVNDKTRRIEIRRN